MYSFAIASFTPTQITTASSGFLVNTSSSIYATVKVTHLVAANRWRQSPFVLQYSFALQQIAQYDGIAARLYTSLRDRITEEYDLCFLLRKC